MNAANGVARKGSAPATAAPQRVLSVFDGVMIIVGIIIGGGIFTFPPLVAGMTGSVQWMFGAWLAGAALALVGALCYAELATTFPNAGGDYHFLTRAYGRDLSFFFAWARVLVITCVRPIGVGDEVTINYHGDPDDPRPVWFPAV